jgi:hypothetical protein
MCISKGFLPYKGLDTCVRSREHFSVIGVHSFPPYSFSYLQSFSNKSDMSIYVSNPWTYPYTESRFMESIIISFIGLIVPCSRVHLTSAIGIHIKVKWSRYRPGVARRVGKGIALLFHDRGTRRGWVVSSTPRPHLPPGKTRHPFYRRLGGPQGRSGRAENLIPTGIRSRTVQPVVSRYTDWATRPT